jgi:hypothetical protein
VTWPIRLAYGPETTLLEDVSAGVRPRLCHRRGVSPGQRRGGIGPVRGADLDGLASLHHPLFARTCLAGAGASAGWSRGDHRQKGGSASERSALTIPEVRRLVLAMREQGEQRTFRLGWSGFRRTHQAVAARGLAARRAHQDGSRCSAGVPPGQAVPLPAEAQAGDQRRRMGAHSPTPRERRNRSRGVPATTIGVSSSGIVAVVCDSRILARDASGVWQMGDCLQALQALVRRRARASDPGSIGPWFRRQSTRHLVWTLSVAVGRSQPVEKDASHDY